jgi:hypothetical protein
LVSRAEWPDWAIFHLLGGCLLWAVFWKLQNLPKLLGHFFTRQKLCINFNKNWVGLHFGQLFLQTHLVTLVSSGSLDCQIVLEKLFSSCDNALRVAR